MPIQIKIISLNTNEFIIEPVRDENLHKGSLSSDSDLSIEIRALKRELESKEINLTEPADYESVKNALHESYPKYQLRFAGKSLVLRALFALPISQIQLARESHSTFQTGITNSMFEFMKLNYATQITERECFAFDVKLVQQVQLDILSAINSLTQNVHATFSKLSPLMEQLNHDLAAINKIDNEKIWETPKYLLAIASVVKAMTEEQALVTQYEPYLIMKGASTLYPKYEKILYATHKAAPTLAKQSELLTIYNKHVRPLGITQNSATASPAPKATVK